MLFHRRLIICSALLVTLSGCGGRKPGQPISPGFNVYSEQQDIELGRQAAKQVLQQVQVVQNRQLQQYISNLGARLARQPEARDYPYEFTLINDPSINAFALPGGPIFVNSGLIRAAENEAQLAGVLAHEIAHVALRHGTSQASKASLLQIPAAIAGVALGQGAAGQLGQLGLGLGLNALIMKYSRGAEEEADALGARILAGAGYNPMEMARFFEKLEGEGGSRAPVFLSSHPSPGNRVRDVQAEIQTLPQREYASNQTGDFQRAQQLVAQLPEPRPQQQQRARAALQPAQAGDFRKIDTQTFSVAYPGNWRAFGGGRGSNMIVAAPEQAVVRRPFGGTTVAYGAVIGYHRGGDFLQRLIQSEPGTRMAGEPRTATAAGVQGQVATLVGESPIGGQEVNFVFAAQRPEGTFYTVFIAPESMRAQAEQTFRQMLDSLQFRQ